MVADANMQASRALEEVDRMLSNASMTAKRVGLEAGARCADVVLELREQVDSVLFVRSVELLTNDQEIYCSSLQGEYRRSIDVEAYVDGRVRLLRHSGTQPDSSLLIYRWVSGGRGAIVTIDGRHVRDALSMVRRNGTDLMLDVGGEVLGRDGIMPSGIVAPSDAIVLQSKLFPISVWAEIPKGELRRRVLADYSVLLLAFAVFGAILGLCARKALSLVGSRRHELERALRTGEFVPYFQPLVSASGGGWLGAEVLIRWEHPKEGIVAPNDFIPLAESTGLIVPMTRGLFDSVATVLSEAEVPDGFRLSFNVSAQHLRCSTIIRDCEAFLARPGMQSVQLVLELTERELLEPNSHIRGIFGALHEMGVKVAVDDFGTGHSSLSYLRDFDMDAIKIDRSFVAKIGENPASEKVLESILEMSRKLNLTVIAEGVERQSQAQFLRELGVPVFQGFLFGRPMAGEVFVRHLQGQQETDGVPVGCSSPSLMI
ncbi:EAL domain-containing protein 6 [Pandoraea anapnoica]|uniref:cyclic-guanylate-specific phosphodiesterase n=2 Tax=Burkholderiaceae TaxID=119060 RepID=A0A5E5AKU3_9BURK|nr:EAL domain-containing protein 6 [Pandoraea anapnoica]